MPPGVLALNLSSEDLRSHAATRAVPSALKGLTTVFEMETGGPPSLCSLEKTSASHNMTHSHIPL